MMLAVCAITLVLVMLMAMIRAFAGPTFFDRVLAVNLFGTKTVLVIALLAFLNGRTDYLDLALTYALINFIGTIAVLKLFQRGHFRSRSER